MISSQPTALTKTKTWTTFFTFERMFGLLSIISNDFDLAICLFKVLLLILLHLNNWFVLRNSFINSCGLEENRAHITIEL